tara:strand:+ start:344 stop:580 length:237 start_codon:yes stop_codon:yes gene_type:complete
MAEPKSKLSSYGLTKKKIIDLITLLENKAPANAAKLRKEFGITGKKKMMSGGLSTMKKKPIVEPKKMMGGGYSMKKKK